MARVYPKLTLDLFFWLKNDVFRNKTLFHALNNPIRQLSI